MSESMLLLDIGNTRLKWVLVTNADEPLPAAQALAHGGDVAKSIREVATALGSSALREVYVASVMGEAQREFITAAVQGQWQVAPRFAASEAQCNDLVNAYAEPQRLGVDRWLAMLALWSRHRSAFTVASAGTALTFDAIDARGQHLGGVIAPGLTANIEATLGRTRFPTGALDASFELGLGRDTEACVRQGALHACAGLLDRLGAQHEGIKVLAGGDAETLRPHLQARWQIESDLVLQGLAIWARLA